MPIETHPKIAANPVQWTTAARQQAERETRVYQESMKRGRRLPPVLKEIQRVAEREQVHIFNVGPWSESVSLGSWGSVWIPACPKGDRYIHCHTFPGIYNEPYPGDGNFIVEPVPGMLMAQCLLGEGPDLRNTPLSESRRKYGVFIGSVVGPDGIKPMDAEINAAMKALEEYMHELILEANKAHADGPREAESRIGSRHRLAAMIANRTDLPWIREQTPQKRVPCQFCGEMISTNLAKCPKCMEIIDQARYNELRGIKAEVAPPVKLPPQRG